MIDVEVALAALSLSDRCRLLGGATNWRTHAIDHAGVPAIKMSDGPNGVRGEGAGPDGTPGVVVPAGITLAATWDVDLVGRIGDLLGRESVRRNAHVLLAPTVNLHRTPVGGRTFECLGEDPELSGRLAAAYVRGVQSHDVAVTVKHFVANDTEVDRMTVDVRADERTLREVYLRPFELAIRDGGAWGVMSAYNRVHGAFCASSRWLLTEVLRDEWGFDGVVVSDWYGAHETVNSARAGLNVEMPGPATVYGTQLEAAVERGEVSPDAVESLVRPLLELANRTRADERPVDAPETSLDDPAERALTREAAIAGTVLLRNSPPSGASADLGPVLPLDVDTIERIAVIGPNAIIDRSIGGGSASLRPFGHRTFLDALTERTGQAAAPTDVVYREGVRIERLTRPLSRTDTTTPDGDHGLAVEFFNGYDVAAPAIRAAVHGSGLIRFFGTLPEEIDPAAFGARVRGTFTADVDGPHDFGIVSTGGARFSVTVGGEEHVVLDDPERTLPRSEEFFGYGHDEATVTVELQAGQTVEVAADWTNHGTRGFAALRLGVRRPEPADLLDQAVAAAADADAAIVVVGTNDEWETEGFDRTTMDLPGRQDELVERVAAANPNTVVIVNAGSPVTLDWAADDHHHPAPAVLTSFFAGQEQAEALVDVVLGVAQPSGRLPVTYPRRLHDTPAFLDHRPDHATADGGVQFYSEGPFVGHRWYDARQIAPRFWFGHGLGYAAARWHEPTASHTTLDADALLAGSTTLEVTVELDGPLGTWPAVEVVQGYVRSVAPLIRRPHKWLAAFTKVQVPAGSTASGRLRFGADAFRHWDVPGAQWSIDPGDYEIVVARSADPADECGRVRVSVVR